MLHARLCHSVHHKSCSSTLNAPVIIIINYYYCIGHLNGFHNHCSMLKSTLLFTPASSALEMVAVPQGKNLCWSSSQHILLALLEKYTSNTLITHAIRKDQNSLSGLDRADSLMYVLHVNYQQGWREVKRRRDKFRERHPV